jgi:hypothetical protein
MSDLFIINDDNAQTVAAEGVAAGRATGWMPSTTRLNSKFTDSYTVIPRAQWKQLVQQGQGTFLSDLIKAQQIPVKDQDGLGYCWVYASTETVEVCRAIQGQAYVDLSPESVGGPLTNWSNQGGDGIDALDQLTKVGACTSSFMDAPNSLAVRRWKAGWQADCANHKITVSWTALSSFDEVFTALLLRLPVSIGLDWWGHQVLLTDPAVLPDGGYGVVFRNSWGNDWPTQGAGGWSTLTESKSQPDGSFAAINVTALDAVWHAGRKVDSLGVIDFHQRLVQKAINKCKRAQ